MPLQVTIASPCDEKWASMRGEGRVRSCDRCALQVYDLAQLTEEEVRALVERSGGRLCGRVYQRRDGTVLTRDCPRGLAKLRRRAAAGLTVALALLASAVSWARRDSSCPSDEERAHVSWFSRVVGTRLEEAKETLRATETFGPLIDRLDPPRHVVGRMRVVPILPASPPTGEG